MPQKAAKSSNPKYIDMVKAAIKANDSRKGVSRQTILKYLIAHYKVDEAKAKAPLKLALKKGIDAKVLTHPPHHANSYRVNAAAEKKPKKKKAVKKVKKTVKKKSSKKAKKPASGEKKKKTSKKSKKTKKTKKSA